MLQKYVTNEHARLLESLPDPRRGLRKWGDPGLINLRVNCLCHEDMLRKKQAYKLCVLNKTTSIPIPINKRKALARELQCSQLL